MTERTITATELEDLGELDRKNRAPRTAGQAGLGASVIVLVDYVLRNLAGIDLDPANPDSTTFPLTVTAALLVVGAWAVSAVMNRRRKATP